MAATRLGLRVVHLEATAPDGVPLAWRGQTIPSGPLRVELDPSRESVGALDYEAGTAAVEFHVLLSFPDVVDELSDLGIAADLLAPLRATVRSSGAILPDHRFFLAGPCAIEDHPLAEGADACVLPGT